MKVFNYNNYIEMIVEIKNELVKMSNFNNKYIFFIAIKLKRKEELLCH